MQNRNKLILATKKKKADYSLKSEPIFIKNDDRFAKVCLLPNGIIGYLQLPHKQQLVLISFQANDELVIDLPDSTSLVKQMTYFDIDSRNGCVLIVTYHGYLHLLLDFEKKQCKLVDTFNSVFFFHPPLKFKSFSSLAILSDQQFTASHQNQLEIWDINNGTSTELDTLNTSKWNIKKLEKLNDGRILGLVELVTGLYNIRSLMLWNPLIKKREYDVPAFDYSIMKALSENQFVVTLENIMYFWDSVPTLKEKGKVKTSPEITSLLHLPDKRLASGHKNGQINIWDIPSRKCVFTFRFSFEPILDMRVLADFSFLYRTQKQYFKADIGLNESLINQYYKQLCAFLPDVANALVGIISSYLADRTTEILNPKDSKFISRPGFFNRLIKSDKDEKKLEVSLR